MSKSTTIPITISAAGIHSVALLAFGLQDGAIPLWEISASGIVNFTFTMQMMALPISFVAMGLVYVYDKTGFKAFFRFNLHMPETTGNEASNWKFLGPVLAVGFTLGTTMYMSHSVITQGGEMNSRFFSLLPLVLLFAATNAWTEEILSRFVLVAGMSGKWSATSICWISALLFGIGHFYGTPSGLFGIIASGFLGWLLAKSVIETRSLFWALFIHFLQDVVIFGAGAMVIAGSM